MDIALRFDPERGYYDLAFEEDLATDPGLETAVVLSLFTDRRALPADALPGGGNDRRGYWADAFSERLQGSRLWLLSREKELESVRRSAEVYAQEALAWRGRGGERKRRPRPARRVAAARGGAARQRYSAGKRV